LATENDGEAGWDLLSRKPSQLSAIMNGGEINEQIGQDEVTGGQKLLRDRKEIEMSDTAADACSEKDKLSNRSNDLLNMTWKMMEEDKIEQERIRRETDEKKERIEGEKKQKVKELEGGSLEARVKSRIHNGQLCSSEGKRQYSIYI
jgi:hypothetical protein